MSIQQCHFSSAISLFKKDFFERWNLIEYSNPLAPALFVGIYNQKDLKTFNDHLGSRLVLFGGADIPNIRYLIGNYQVAMDEFTFEHSTQFYNWLQVVKFIRIPFKSFANFQPAPLGEKIYCYQSGNSLAHQEKYKFNLLKKVINYFGADKVITGLQGHSINYIREVYYKNSFINLQFNPIAGFTTTLEMAHMGRQSISNYKAPFCLSFSHSDDIINQIKIKMELRGKEKVESLVPKGFFHESEDWLDTDFWK